MVVLGVTAGVVVVSLAAGVDPGALPGGAVIGVLVLVGAMLFADRGRR